MMSNPFLLLFFDQQLTEEMTKDMSECKAKIAVLNESDILGPKNTSIPYLFTNYATTPSKMESEEKISDF